MICICIIIVITSDCRSLLHIGLPQCEPFRPLYSLSHPFPGPFQIVITPYGRKASYTTVAESWSLLKNSIFPSVICSLADMTSPLPLQLCYFTFMSITYVGNVSENTSFHSSLNDFNRPSRLHISKLLFDSKLCNSVYTASNFK